MSIDGSGEDSGSHEYEMARLMSSREFSFFKEVCKNDDEKTDQKEFVPNSEKQYGCWYIENPMTKDLTKHISFGGSTRPHSITCILLWRRFCCKIALSTPRFFMCFSIAYPLREPS